MNREKVLIVGGRGFFGRLLVDDLLANSNCLLVVGSREPFRDKRFETVVVDLSNSSSLERALSGVKVAICAAGPYQKMPPTLAHLCISLGVHYIDLADHREFVEMIRSLAITEKARTAVCTAWSTVSALSGVLTRIASDRMSHIDSIHINMAPGNRGARHTATIASLLNSVGRPFSICRNGARQEVIGWSEPRAVTFPPPVGRRRGYLVDVPDHAIFPGLFNARTVEFRAGSELPFLNGVLSLLRMTGRNWSNWSSAFQRAAALFSRLGHDCGAIGVEITGSKRRRASIVADSRGERLAVMPAAVTASALLSGRTSNGMISFRDWISESELRSECARRGFRLIVEEL